MGQVDSQLQQVRTPQTEGQPVSRATLSRIPSGMVVEGLVVAQEGNAYQVRIGSQLLNAQATLPLFVGQRFRAVWDNSGDVPVLRLQQSDLAMIACFSGKDQQVAQLLLARGLPVSEEVLWDLRSAWLATGGDPRQLGSVVELWARGIPVTQGNVETLSWYLQLLPEQAAAYWKEIRDRLRSRSHSSPKELLKALEEGGGDASKFLKAHGMASRPIKEGISPAMLSAPSWWPVGQEEFPLMARVSFANREWDEKKICWVAFGLEGKSLGPIEGEALTNGKALSASLRAERDSTARFLKNHLSTLRRDLGELAIPVQNLAVGVIASKDAPSGHGVDMEA